MAYIALYRKYRSQNFGELMGQEAVTTTLQNAIRAKRIAHAYLFYGARGCGKTSTARLLAKALNCIGPDGTRTEPTPEPCDVCRLCESIREGRCMDVIEMDAASETGIDDVREKIIENVQYAPAEARYKVYIIDEVHDLSSKAFDALLKTLEEPPAHVIFVLATTELQKVPITIQSRSQRYQFKRGSLQDLGAAIQRVIEAEGYTAESEAVESIARSAEGSWRDALSLLEQVLAYSDGHITADTVHRAIGTVGSETLARVTETLATGDWSATLGMAADLIDSGKDARQLMTALSGHLRDLLLISAGAKTAAQAELGAERFATLSNQATLFDPPTLLSMMSVLSAAEKEVRFSNQHRWILERTLLNLLVAGQGNAGASVAPSAVVAAPRAMTPSARPTERPTPSTPVREAPPIHEAPRETVPPLAASALMPSSAAVSPTPDAAYASPDVRPVPTEEVAPLPETVHAVTPPIAPPAPYSNGTANGSGYTNGSASATPPVATPVSPPPAAPPPSSSPASPTGNAHRFADAVTYDVIKRAWPRIVKLVKQTSPSGGMYLDKAEVISLDGQTITLSFADQFSRDRIQNKGKELVERKINEAMNAEGYRVRCVLKDDPGSGGSPVPARVPPPVSPDDDAMDMATLLDTPPVAPASSGPSRIMDFEMPVAPPPPSSNGYGNGGATNGAATNGNGSSSGSGAYSSNGTNGGSPRASAAPAKVPEPPPDESGGMLKEVLELFGGTVVRVE